MPRLGAFARETTPFSIIHVTGERDFPRVAQALAQPGGNARYQAHAYLDDFPLALAAATVAVSRAGGSVAELLARGVPALLVPFPLATADHQTKNALALQAAGAAVMVPDGEFDAARMKAELTVLLRASDARTHERGGARAGASRRGYPYRRRDSRIGRPTEGCMTMSHIETSSHSPAFAGLKRFHFIGIGGAGMSGIALVLHRRGYEVTGSDLKPSRYVSLLEVRRDPRHAAPHGRQRGPS